MRNLPNSFIDEKDRHMMLKQLEVNWRYLLIAPLLLTALCTAFIKHNGINLTNPEALLSYLLLGLLGLLPGLIMIFGGLLLRLLTISGLLAFFLLSQTKGLPGLPFGLRYVYIAPFFLVGLMAFLYCIREKLDRFLLIIFTVFWVGAFFTHQAPLLLVQNFPSYQTKESAKLPPYIEIVLDEQIGIQGGLLLEKDADYFSKDLIDGYVNKGFTVYGQAYSRDFQTLSSFASFLNFKPLDNLDEYLQQEKGVSSITHNKLFEDLSEKGYEINVLQSSYVDVCEYKNQINLKKCSTYNYAAPIPYPMANIKEKSIDIIDNIFSVVPYFNKLSHTLLALLFPGSKRQTIVEASTATYRAFPEMLKLAKEVSPGNAYFIHLLIPHYPYVFSADCEYLGDRGKTAATYLEQVKCAHRMMDKFLLVLSSNPAAANSTIIIHGDHGFRIPKPSAKKSYSFTLENIAKIYNTFFVVKSPIVRPGYNTDLLPIDYILKSIMARKPIDSYNPKKQFVYLRSDKHTDKPFDRGVATMSQIVGES